VLTDFVPGYRPFDTRFPFLFNSYYEAKGERIAGAARGLLTRPSLDETRAYRSYVDEAVQRALDNMPSEAQELIALGCGARHVIFRRLADFLEQTRARCVVKICRQQFLFFCRQTGDHIEGEIPVGIRERISRTGIAGQRATR
jgi:hypothetical protein